MHDKGRQQTINTFNNNTRHLIFKRNKRKKEPDNRVESLPMNSSMLNRMSTPDGYVSVEISHSENELNESQTVKS